ncbi:hypothetical protein [Erwinia mallotivora]|uniref:hypothetical protein n=1 Tax=Erwinia mallotivora TaxID=69222 RepID=UPI0021C161C9|nr:hypothetical protein [Erwinia mallotivora]
MTQVRRPSPLQRRVLIVLAALDAKRPGPVATRDIERLLEQGGDAPVYGPNLRASCRRLEAAGWLRTLRAPNLRLAVELTDAGRAVATPLLTGLRDEEERRRHDAEHHVLPVRPAPDAAPGITVALDGVDYVTTRAAYVITTAGEAYLLLHDGTGHGRRLRGDAVTIAKWYSACHEAGLPAQVQVNEE